VYVWVKLCVPSVIVIVHEDPEPLVIAAVTVSLDRRRDPFRGYRVVGRAGDRVA
jgi:hypothetical protein